MLLDAAAWAPDRYSIIDAEQTKYQIADEILNLCQRRFAMQYSKGK